MTGLDMPPPIRLSVLVPTIPQRLETALAGIVGQVYAQAKDSVRAELVVYLDNQGTSVGGKRSLLYALGAGLYLASCDDDDEVADDYVQALVSATYSPEQPDVIAFNQAVGIHGVNIPVHFGGPGEEPYKHIHAWHHARVRGLPWPDVNWCDDGPWRGAADWGNLGRPNLRYSGEGRRPPQALYLDRMLYRYKVGTSSGQLGTTGPLKNHLEVGAGMKRLLLGTIEDLIEGAGWVKTWCDTSLGHAMAIFRGPGEPFTRETISAALHHHVQWPGGTWSMRRGEDGVCKPVRDE